MTTKAVTATGLHMAILLGDGANPESFPPTAAVGLITRTFSRTTKKAEFEMPDYDNPDLPQYVDGVLTSKSCTIQGDGYLDATGYPLWDAAFEGGVAVDLRIRFDKPTAIQGTTYQGAFFVTKLDAKGEHGKKLMVSLELQSVGDVVKSNT